MNEFGKIIRTILWILFGLVTLGIASCFGLFAMLF